MSTYLLKYFNEGDSDDIGLLDAVTMNGRLVEWFVVEADDLEHAVEQLMDAYPEANLVAGYECVPVTPIIQG